MRPQDVIRKKRDGEHLSREEITFFIEGVTRGTIADYQISALLMAIFLNGMNDAEQGILTEAMLNSGNILDFSHIAKPKADKHSTGGVGDKTSLLIAPMVAALSRQTLQDTWGEYRDLFASWRLGRLTAITTLLWDCRFSLVTIALAGFGRAIAEIGAVMTVGGNIAGSTRVMTTGIALEASKGDLALALGLGIVLLVIVLVVMFAAQVLQQSAQRRYGGSR